MNKWEEEIILPSKGPGIEYAYMLKSSRIPIKCNKETLLKVIETDESVEFVTTPENSTFIIPGSDYETIQPILLKKKASVEKTIFFSFFYTLIFGGLMLLFNYSSDRNNNIDLVGKLNLLIFGIVPLITGYYELFIINRVNALNYKKESEEIKFEYWVKSKNCYSIYIATGLLVLIYFLQFFSGIKNSVELAKLVKLKVLAGE